MNQGFLMSIVVTAFVLTTACSSSSPLASSFDTSTPTAAPPAVADGDWPGYNRTPAGDRFSPLAEIDRSNVAQLKQICMYTLPEVSSLQTGPLVVSGTMYFTTVYPNRYIEARPNSDAGAMALTRA